MTKLQLVVDNAKAQRASHVRPIQIVYYASRLDKDSQWSRRSRAATTLGAVRASVVWMLRGHCCKVHIYGEDGVMQVRIEKRGREIQIHGWFESLTFDKDR